MEPGPGTPLGDSVKYEEERYFKKAVKGMVSSSDIPKNEISPKINFISVN